MGFCLTDQTTEKRIERLVLYGSSRSRLAARNPHRGPIHNRVLSTKYTDDEPGLVMYQLRAYSPELGRFISRDPIEEEGGVNLYGFVDNNPAGTIDCLGLVDIDLKGSDRSWLHSAEVTYLAKALPAFGKLEFWQEVEKSLDWTHSHYMESGFNVRLHSDGRYSYDEIKRKRTEPEADLWAKEVEARYQVASESAKIRDKHAHLTNLKNIRLLNKLDTVKMNQLIAEENARSEAYIRKDAAGAAAGLIGISYKNISITPCPMPGDVGVYHSHPPYVGGTMQKDLQLRDVYQQAAGKQRAFVAMAQPTSSRCAKLELWTTTGAMITDKIIIKY